MKLTNYPTESTSNKKTIIIVLVAVVVILGGLFTLDRLGVINLPFVPDKHTKLTGDEINYEPPTEEEKKETDQFKENLGNQANNQPPPTPSGQKKNVTPTISSWGQTPGNQNVEVGGYVTGVFEEGGTCTAELKKDGQTITGSRTAAASAQNVSCGFISIERAKLSPGVWSITLSYASNTAQGTSQAVTLDVK